MAVAISCCCRRVLTKRPGLWIKIAQRQDPYGPPVFDAGLVKSSQAQHGARRGGGGGNVDVATVAQDLPAVSIDDLSRLVSAESSEPHFSRFCFFRE